MKDLFEANKGVTQIRASVDDILAAKAEVRRAGSETYVKLVRMTHHPSARNRLRVIPGTETLLKVRNALEWVYPLFVLFIPLALVFIAPWWFAFVVLAILFLSLNSLQREINLELGARLLVITRKLENQSTTEVETRWSR